jgi:CHAT domain-containing protein
MARSAPTFTLKLAAVLSCTIGSALVGPALVGLALVSPGLISPALALTHEQIVEACRETAHPKVHACMESMRGTGNRDSNLEHCRATVGHPIVQACVQREEQKAAAGKAAPGAPQAADVPVDPKAAAAIVPVFVAPPRTIADITAILDSEKPDEAKIAARKTEADATPPTGAPPPKLAQFYYDRGNARALLGRNKEAIADGLQALTLKNGIEFRRLIRIRQFVAIQYRLLGDPKQAIEIFDSIVREAPTQQSRGAMINALTNLTRTALTMGDVNQADAYARRVQALVQEARGSPNPNWRQSYIIYGNSWESDGNAVQAMLFEAHGQYSEAEAAYRRAEAFRRAALKDLPRYEFPPPPEQLMQNADALLLSVARNESKQQRLSQAEADARRALLDVLGQSGKYSPASPSFILGLAGILVEEGRYQEAQQLAQSALDVQRTLGIGDDSPQSVSIMSQLGNILVLQGKIKDAGAVYADMDKALAQWTAPRREAFQLNGSRIAALYAAGQTDAGIAAAEDLVKRETGRFGANSFDTGAAHGMLAVGYARAKRDADALREFKTAIPVMMAAAREKADNDDDPTIVATRDVRLQRVVEAYIALLGRTASGSNDAAIETFALADAVRGHAVQQSLADSSARLVAKDPALADLVRSEQDLSKQISAQLGALNNLLSLPSDQRDDQTTRAVTAEIAKLRSQSDAAKREINRRFPSYASLINPRPASVAAIKAALRPDEAMLSFYIGQNNSFVWAVPKDGAVAFAAIPVRAIDLEAKIHRLRQALEPQVARVEQIPPFDLALANELYATLLAPVESGWKPAKSLIVVSNGALGELPIGLLPTAPSEVDAQAQPLFAGYRNVPWLARTHAVTVVPSAVALVTLRSLPAGSPKRDTLIGFGDPYFSQQEADEADREQSQASDKIAAAAESDSSSGTDGDAMRGAPLKLRASPHTEEVDRAELALLPRLPDTRQELTAIAQALNVDPAKALYLGRDANEQKVETLDLAHYRIVAFATHGLVPGDLDGLTQPALALTAPEVAGITGDGLLTMEEILALKLDADWVVLSACNTAAGAGAGAEAASGLGSAFFYAGTRALLVTNWSVHSASARELTTDLFRRQSVDPGLTRSEALRQAMMALLDGAGSVDSAGHTNFTYAHPLFWAPYSVIGDGGGS